MAALCAGSSSASSRRGLARLLAIAGVLCAVSLGCDPRSRTIGEDFRDGTSEAGAGGVSQPGDEAGRAGAGGAPADAGAGGEGSVAVAGAAGTSACAGGIAVTSQLPRLTNEQYERTVRDLLGVTTLSAFDGAAPASLLAPYHTGPLTELDWQTYWAVGQAVAAQVIADQALLTRFVACTPVGAGDECLHDTVVSFGRRAFRRPLTEAEIARFDAIIALGPEITETGSPEEVAEVLLNTFLVSPSFLLRTEISETRGDEGTFVLSPQEVASRLSFMLWGSTPDAELDAVADAGELASREQILAQATRMLADAKARDVVRHFHRHYLRMGSGSHWDSVTKDPARYPEFTPSVARTMAEETERFFETLVLEQDASFEQLFSSPLAFVNADTAGIYGLDSAGFGAELEAVNLDPETRPGFLTRVGFLSAHANLDRSSPVLRGAAIVRDILGIDVGAPTPAAMATPLPDVPDARTNRERVEAQTAAAECTGCHATYINPPGFVLEAFDAIGRFRTTEAGNGAPLDTSADVIIDGEPIHVRDPADLMRRIASSHDARTKYVKDWLWYAYARADDPSDACTIEELTAKISDSGYRVVDLLRDLTQTDSFRLRVREATP